MLRTPLYVSLLVGLLLVCACGDDQPAGPPGGPGADAAEGVPVEPAPPEPSLPAAPDAPFEAYFDDEWLVEHMLYAAQTGKLDVVTSLELPPRVSPARASVELLHDVLLERRTPQPERERVWEVFEAVAKLEGGADQGVLAEWLPVWRAWTQEQQAAEAELARRVSFGIARLSSGDPGKLPDMMEVEPDAPEFPPMSPAGATLTLLRAARTAFQDAPGTIDLTLKNELQAAADAFDAIRWPGGYGKLAEIVAAHLAQAAPSGMRYSHFATTALSGLENAGDAVGGAALLIERAMLVGTQKPSSARRSAQGAVERLKRVGARGRELSDALHIYGAFTQAAGDQARALRFLEQSLAESEWAGLPPAHRVRIHIRLATARYAMGQLEAAAAGIIAAAEEFDREIRDRAGELAWMRASYDMLQALVLVERGDGAGGAELYRLAAMRYDQLAGADQEGRAAFERDSATLRAADALVKGGFVDDALPLLASVLEKDGVRPSSRAHAAAVYREAGQLERAREQLSRAERDGGVARFGIALAEEWARLLAKEGNVPRARLQFQRASQVLERRGADQVLGVTAARVYADWAALEIQAGELARGSDLLQKAVQHAPYEAEPMACDGFREQHVDVNRRRGWFRLAETIQEARLVDGVIARTRSPAEAETDALLDLFLIRLELALSRDVRGSRSGAKTYPELAIEAAGALPEGPLRELAVAAAERSSVDLSMGAGATDDLPDVEALGAALRVRGRALRDTVALLRRDPGRNRVAAAIDLAANLSADEPELRRAAALVGLADPALSPEAGLRLIELRRGSGDVSLEQTRASLAEKETLVLVEPCGDFSVVLQVGAGATNLSRAPLADALRELWNMVNTEPDAELIASAAEGVATGLLPLVEGLGGEDVTTLCLSLPSPWGPLPYPLLPFDEGPLIETVAVTTVASASERVEAASLPEPAAEQTVLQSSGHTRLTTRWSLVPGVTLMAAMTDEESARLVALIAEQRVDGVGIVEAVRRAQLAMRAEWETPDHPRTPAWATVILRGAE